MPVNLNRKPEYYEAALDILHYKQTFEQGNKNKISHYSWKEEDPKISRIAKFSEMWNTENIALQSYH